MPKKTARRFGQKARRKWIIFAIVLASLAGAIYVALGATISSYTTAATAYSARVACSCRYVAGRSLEDCARDKIAGMELVRLSENSLDQSVTASIPLVRSQSARFRDGYGCVLEEWDGD